MKDAKKMNGWVIGGLVLVVAVVAIVIWYNSPKQKEKRKMEAEEAKKAEAVAKAKETAPKLANAPLPGSKMLISAQA